MFFKRLNSFKCHLYTSCLLKLSSTRVYKENHQQKYCYNGFGQSFCIISLTVCGLFDDVITGHRRLGSAVWGRGGKQEGEQHQQQQHKTINERRTDGPWSY